MFAESSDLVQIANLITGMVTTCFSAYLAYLMYKVNIGQKQAAEKVEQVKSSLENHRAVSVEQLAVLAQDVEVVKKQTNGLMEVMKNQAEDKGFAAGAASEHVKK